MRVLIADDEYLARSSLKSMLLELGLEVNLVGEATNGEEMAAIAGQHFPDVAFVDIRMPKLNGLEAIRRAKDASPQTRWYILTGFTQFDYAQEAIRLGVSGYLLKPVNPEELQKVMSEVIEDSRRQKATHNRQFERELMALSYGLASLEPDERDSVIATFHFIGGLLALDSSQPEQHKAERQLGFCHRIREVVSDYSETDNRIALFVLPNGDLVTVGAWEPTQFCEGGRRLRMYFQTLEQEARNWSQDDLAITVLGPLECHTHRDLQDGLDRLHWLSPLRVVCGIGGKLDASILEAQAGIPGRQELASLILNLCHHYRDRGYLNYMQAVQALEKPVTNAIDSPNLLKTVADFLNRSINCSFLSVQPTRLWLQALQQHGEPLLTEAMKDEVRGTDLIAQVTTFVDENFMLNIGIGQIAEQLNITPNYLSALFHRKTGTNFMSYLKKIRMVKAKELLADPNIQVQQVAEKVGYISARHFARLFAEHFGCLPSEYRDSLRGG